MPNFCADFDVRGTLVLPTETVPLTPHSDDPACDVTIRNAEPDAAGHIPHLSIQVVAACDTIDAAPKKLRSMLAHQLDLLTYVTQSTFVIEQCRRVMEWEPNQRTRALKALQQFDPLYPPDRELESEHLQTAQAISDARPPGYMRRALRYFRLGVLSPQPEDQFQHFWLAIETIAEGSKEGTKLSIPCPKCSNPLRCQCCNTTPMRRPMARQAIRELIGKVVKSDPATVYRSLVAVRDDLAHGRLPEAIEAQTGRSLGDLVDMAGAVAWHVIFSSLPKMDGSALFSHRGGQFVNEQLITGAVLTFTHDGEGEHPSEDKIPNVKIELMVRFGSPSTGKE